MKPLTLVQVLVYSTANLGANLVMGFTNFAFPLFLGAYGLPNILVGFLAQERSFIGGFVQPVVGAISDRLPPNRLGRRRPFFLVGVPLTAVSLLFFSSHPPMWAVVSVMLVFSFFLAVAVDPYTALMADIVPEGQRGRVGGAMAVFNMIGQVTVVLLSFVLWESHQRELFWLVAAGMVVAFGVTFFGTKEPPIIPREGVASRGSRPDVRTYLAGVLAERAVVRYLAATFFFWLGNGGIAPFITRFAVSVLGVEENQSFLLVLPAIFGTAIFAVPAGILTEKYGKKPVLNIGMLLFGAIALVGGTLVATVPQAMVMMSVVGVANAITTALIFPFLADLMPRERAGEFTGVGAMVWSISQTVGALGAGAVADATGTLRVSFALAGLFMLLASLLMLSVSRGKMRPVPNTLFTSFTTR